MISRVVKGTHDLHPGQVDISRNYIQAPNVMLREDLQGTYLWNQRTDSALRHWFIFYHYATFNITIVATNK